jgi:hypothetical protein
MHRGSFCKLCTHTQNRQQVCLVQTDNNSHGTLDRYSPLLDFLDTFWPTDRSSSVWCKQISTLMNFPVDRGGEQKRATTFTMATEVYQFLEFKNWNRENTHMQIEGNWIRRGWLVVRRWYFNLIRAHVQPKPATFVTISCSPSICPPWLRLRFRLAKGASGLRTRGTQCLDQFPKANGKDEDVHYLPWKELFFGSD